MTTIAAHTTWMTGRQLKAIARQPAYVAIMLIQPVIWLFLFGSLFRKVVELPGFGAQSYLDYLVPGVVVMSALSASMWPSRARASGPGSWPNSRTVRSRSRVYAASAAAF